jgi:hypothetical protein
LFKVSKDASALVTALTLNADKSATFAGDIKTYGWGAHIGLTDMNVGIKFVAGSGNDADMVFCHYDGTDRDWRWCGTTDGGSSLTDKMKLLNNGDLTVAGDVLSNSHNSSNLGSSGVRWANLYVADVQMSNEGTGGNEIDGTEGSWTIQEGEDDLFLLNRKNGKKYKFKLEEM